MEQITSALISETHKEMWAELVKKHKTAFAVPFDEIMRVNEVLRGMNVLMLWQKDGSVGRTALGALSAYSVMNDAVEILIKNLHIKHEVRDVEKTEKRKDKWQAFEEWAKENRGQQFTTEQLVEQSGFSYQTTLKFVSESPLFTKVKKGIWNIASPERD